MVENNTSHEFPEMRRIRTIHFVGIGGAGTVSYKHLTLPNTPYL